MNKQNKPDSQKQGWLPEGRCCWGVSEKDEGENSQKYAKFKDGGVGRYTVPPHTTKRGRQQI